MHIKFFSQILKLMQNQQIIRVLTLCLMLCNSHFYIIEHFLFSKQKISKRQNQTKS